jgi:Polysaccharide deacetylase
VCGAASSSGSSVVSGSTKKTTANAITTSSPPTTTGSSTVKAVDQSLASSAAAAGCTDLLIDDWASQSRLTFLGYNALQESSSDDGTMKSVIVDTSKKNHVTFTPANTNSYWYTEFGCLSATNKYGGIGFTATAVKGSTFSVDIQTSASCDSGNYVSHIVSSATLGITFDGTEKYYTLPFSKFANLDLGHITAIQFLGFNHAVKYGPIAAYCGTTGKAFAVPATVPVVEPSSTIPATTGPTSYVIDAFANADSNALGHYHGGDDATTYKLSGGKIIFNTAGNSDLSWYTQVTDTCTDLTKQDSSYLHIAYTGSNAFSVALQQHNSKCDETINPYPFTWDDVEASRYTNTAKTDIYIPLSHFKIDKTKSIGFALKGFYTTATTTVSKIEMVKTVPSGFLVPSKLTTAPLVFACTRPNSFAFAIDDGVPELAQQVVAAVKAAGVKFTFFTLGLPMQDTSTNFSAVYNEMLSLGHQVAYHSYTHPPMEGLPDLESIDWELTNDVAAVKQMLNGHTSKLLLIHTILAPIM